MREPAYLLGQQERFAVLRALREVREYRGWEFAACHVRTMHVHVVMTSEEDGKKVLNDFKAYASRATGASGGLRTAISL